MARLVVTRRAFAQIESAFQYIAKDSPKYAIAWRKRMKAAMRSLEKYPLRGFPSTFYDEQNLRVLLEGTYKIFYTLGDHGDVVTVVMVLHQAQLPPELES